MAARALSFVVAVVTTRAVMAMASTTQRRARRGVTVREMRSSTGRTLPEREMETSIEDECRCRSSTSTTESAERCRTRRGTRRCKGRCINEGR